MSTSRIQTLGKVGELWRYPVKSMQGESIEKEELTELGFVGDRMLALMDVATGRIASARSPRMWPNLVDFRARLTEPPTSAAGLPAVEIIKRRVSDAVWRQLQVDSGGDDEVTRVDNQERLRRAQERPLDRRRLRS